MKAIILAAGVARRLAPLTDRTHKCLFPVGDRPLLARMLDALESVGVSQVKFRPPSATMISPVR